MDEATRRKFQRQERVLHQATDGDRFWIAVVASRPDERGTWTCHTTIAEYRGQDDDEVADSDRHVLQKWKATDIIDIEHVMSSELERGRRWADEHAA
jgi:hypothetical protein